jgi:aspartate/methionine/tyrosine aminotransferase
MNPARRTANIEYAIGEVVIPARKLESQGIDIIKLNLGDPDKFDFDAPEHMKKAVIAEMNRYNGYGDSEGIPELREAIVKREKKKNDIDLAVDDVLVTNGTSEAILMLYGALLNPGDEVLVPGPVYPPYVGLATFFDGKPVPFRTIEEENWAPDIEDIRKKITEKTKALVLINPSNPTGAFYDKSMLQELGDIVAEHDLVFISDEIYDTMVLEGTHYSPTFMKDIPVVSLNGVSKAYLATGWRVGWLMFTDPNDVLGEIKEACFKQARMRISANIPMQKGALAGLTGPQDHMKKVVADLKERRDYIHKRLNDIDGISTQKPGGSFYIFPKIEGTEDDKSFVLDVLHKAHVLFVHGSGFSKAYGKGHFRSVFLPPVPVLEKALDALEQFMKNQ